MNVVAVEAGNPLVKGWQRQRSMSWKVEGGTEEVPSHPFFTQEVLALSNMSLELPHLFLRFGEKGKKKKAFCVRLLPPYRGLLPHPCWDWL